MREHETCELEPLLIGVKDACRLICVRKSSLYKLIKDGVLRPSKIGAKTVFSYAELRRYAEGVLAQRDQDTEAPARSIEARRRRSHRQSNPQPQTRW